MRPTRKETGRQGEQIAAEYLLRNGYQIIARNFTTRYAELDIVALRQDTVCFIEVKTKRSLRQGKPYEEVTRKKIAHLKRAIESFLKLHPRFARAKYSIEVISIVLDAAGTSRLLQHFKDVPL